MFLATSYSSKNSVFELIGMILIFIIILVASYFTSKWIGKANMISNRAKNISVIETFRISPSKCLQIIKVGNRYIVIGITKEHIEMLTEINEEDIDLNLKEGGEPLNFQQIFSQAKKTWGDKIKKDESKD